MSKTVDQSDGAHVGCNDIVMQLLAFFADHDLHGLLFWRCDDEFAPITFWINTNDLFAWACADGEEVNADNFAELRRAVEECEAIDDTVGAIDGCMLFACRMNKMRPQGAAYPDNRDLWPLFDACGPERDTGFGNPHKPGDYKRSLTA